MSPGQWVEHAVGTVDGFGWLGSVHTTGRLSRAGDESRDIARHDYLGCVHRRRRFLAYALAAPAVLAACAASPDKPKTPASPAAVARPPDGISLRQLGFGNGPVDAVFLPLGVVLTRTVDQVNVTTALGPGGQGAAVQAYLRRTLPTGVWTVDTDQEAALLFHSADYDGAFTTNADLWGLTLRRRTG